MKHSVDQLYEAVQTTRPLLRNITAAVEQVSSSQGVTVGQRAILEGLSLYPGATAPLLVAKLQLKRQYVSRILKEVKQAGLVESRANPRHARSCCYDLTPMGTRTILAIRADEMANLAFFAAGFSPQELTHYHKVQLALSKFFSEMANEA